MSDELKGTKLSIESAMTGAISHAQNPNVLSRARDFYATYCASSDGKNYQGLPCPAWDALTPAVRGHWYTVALRSLQLESIATPSGVGASDTLLGSERSHLPNSYVVSHLPDPERSLGVWREYSGFA